MSHIKPQVSYAEIVSKSRDLTKTLSKSSLSKEIGIVDALEISLEGGDVSIWSVYEAILAIHCLTNDDNPRFRNFFRLVRANLLRGYYKFKRKLQRKKINNTLPGLGPNIFFLGFTQYLAGENFELIFEKMTRDSKYCPILLIDEPHKGVLADYLNLDINSFDNESILLRSDGIGKIIRHKMAEVRVLIAHSDISLSCKFNLRKSLSFFAPLAERHIQKHLAVAEWLLNHHRPSAIVSIDTADPRTRVFSLLANKLGIPVVQIQAGAINQECIEWSFCNDDLMLCHGPKEKNELKKLGFDTRNVVSCGSAKFEKLVDVSADRKVSLSNRFKFPNNKTTIILLTSYTSLFGTSPKLRGQYKIYDKAYLNIIAEASICDNVSLIIKPHPLEKSEGHYNLSSNYNNIFVARSSENTSDLIASADVVISFGSTATLDAIILGKPAIVVNFDGFTLNPFFAESKFCLLPKNSYELSHIFSQINQGEIASILSKCKVGRDAFLGDINYFKDSPSDVIIQKIFELIESSNNQREAGKDLI